MHLIKPFAAVAGVALLAGCQPTPEITTPPVDMTYTQRGLQIQKYDVTAVRTYIRGENNTRQLVEGVPCKVKGGGFHARFRSSANLRLPVTGINSSDLTVTCTYEGREISRSYSVQNYTKEGIANSGATGGLVGALIAVSVASARGDHANDNYGYDDISFMLSPPENTQ